MSCPYKYNQTERELNRFVFNILTFMRMRLTGRQSQIAQGYLMSYLHLDDVF